MAGEGEGLRIEISQTEVDYKIGEGLPRCFYYSRRRKDSQLATDEYGSCKKDVQTPLLEISRGGSDINGDLVSSALR